MTLHSAHIAVRSGDTRLCDCPGTSPACRLILLATRTLVLLSLLILTASATLLTALDLYADTQDQLAVDRFMQSRGLPDKMAVIITDIATGETVASAEASTPLVPASIMKTVTIASLMRQAGGEHTWDTKVYVDGPVKKGVLHGNLVIEGSGDPSLNSKAAPESPDITAEITKALRDKNIDRIQGRIIIDEDIFSGPAVPPSWAKGDLMHAYGTGTHGLNYRNNSSGKMAVTNPAQIFEQDIRRAFAEDGIEMENEQVTQGRRTLLFTHHSAPIAEIMRSCMMRSDNLYAESLLRKFAIERQLPGATEEAAAEEMKFWKERGVDLHGVRIIDGSGLSRANRVTANMINDVLRDMAEDVDYVSYFPLAGQEGTLKKFLVGTPLDSYIAMKTGSMSGIQCYAGYKLDEQFAPTHTVVVIVNDFRCDRSTVRSAVQRMLLDIFSAAEDDTGEENESH